MEYLKDGKISAGHARALLTLENEELMTELADEIVAKDLSVRQVEKICKKNRQFKRKRSLRKSLRSTVWLNLHSRKALDENQRFKEQGQARRCSSD